ncbi:hypothetical protein ACIGO8_28575 [Streptomyces sp. NPDC053493]|uniref:hypothetical protein n=1 Tax=Streptomyces sp. NPDC053493 TaxID=3365705 RepID=UPI0037D4377F
MSARTEREALSSRPSLYAYVLGRLGADAGPVGRRAVGGCPPPEADPPPEGPRLRGRKAAAAVRTALGPLLAGPDTPAAAALLQRRLTELPLVTGSLVGAVLSLPLDDEAAARAHGRRLVRTGTTIREVSVGLALLRRLGEPEDVPYLRTISHLDGLSSLAVAALEPLDPQVAALCWLDDRIKRPELRPLVDALLSGSAREAGRLLVARPLDARTLGPSAARRIAEAAGLAGLLRRDRVDPRLLAQAGRLLVRMASPRDYRTEILAYGEAVEVCEAFVRRAAALPPGVDHAAVVLSLAADLHSGPAHLLPWHQGQREQLLDALGALLASPAWQEALAEPGPDAAPAVRRRAAWLRHTSGLVFGAPAPPGRLRIEVLARDPAEENHVETRFLVDGRPLVPEVFGRGSGDAPEGLLHEGRLVATEEPREVRLAEAWCSEGCCGALRVTVVREGGEVVWRDWRHPARLPSGEPAPELPEYRFDAAAYDAELARATADIGWSSRARTTGRLIAEGLRERPALLARWDCRLAHAGADGRTADTTEVWFDYRPGTFEGEPAEDGPWLQFVWRLPDDGSAPADRAAGALRRLAEEDPRAYAECRWGRR